MISHQTYVMSKAQTLDFIEPKRDAQGNIIGPGAIMMTADNWNKLKTTLEVSCRLLGKRCTYEMQQAIRFKPETLRR